MTSKIQYFLPDLAFKLGIGEIKSIFLAEQDGKPVLRIECENIANTEYRTVKVKVVEKSSGGVKGVRINKKSGKSAKPANNIKPHKTFAEKAMEVSKDFFLNPERNKGKREMFGGKQFGSDADPFGDDRWE